MVRATLGGTPCDVVYKYRVGYYTAALPRLDPPSASLAVSVIKI